MSFLSDLSQSQEYLTFRGSVPLRRIVVDVDNTKGWKIYDCGPKKVHCPLVCLPSVCGTADIFFKQALALSEKGIRVIAAEAPVYWDVNEWCEGFKRLLDYLDIYKVHIFGSSLGGYLAQKFAEHTISNPKVASLILCNSFTDTSIFNNHDSAAIFWILPTLVLKRMIVENITSEKIDPKIVEAAEFIIERIDTIPQAELASRITLNSVRGYVETNKLADLAITIIDVFDEYALSSSVRDEMSKSYPNAKLAHLKSGGNFPYLSRSEEVNLHLQIHLRQFDGTPISASDRPLIKKTNS